MAPEFHSDEAVEARAFPDDGERLLVLAARSGDQAACREIYRTYREPIWALIVSLVGDPVQAQDVIQNVFFKAFRGLPGFRFRSALFTWIVRIAHNECRNHQRKKAAPCVPLEDILGSRYEADGRNASGRPEGPSDVLRDAVNGLPLKMREVVVLKYQQDLSYEEMSRVLRCPPGTVASRLNRALAALEERLRPGGAPEEGAAGAEERR